ncbi:MAG TPA: PAS domain-containing sensor histidine kinase [Candidatus Pacearchaeota archaeon]|nr:PAS domain-containing sensor histidine kinase [Candidatus Pacearchaeota archaeon]
MNNEKNSINIDKDKILIMVNNFPDGLLIVDEKENIELISPSTEYLLKQKKENIVGKNLYRISSSEIDLKPLIKVFKEKEEKNKEEVTLNNLLLEVSSFNFQNNKGRLIIVHDVSRGKLVEKMKTEFVSIAAHQLRTPLSAIKWSLKMILDGDAGEVSKEQKELLEKTYSSNERMIGLINDLLNVTRIEEGRFLYNPEEMQLEEIIINTLKDFEEIIKIKKVDVKFKSKEKQLPPLIIDKEKMTLAIHNLLDNAIKYTVPHKGKINISLEQKNNDVIFKIEDNGVGIPKDQYERIFSRFFRGDNVIKMETQGSGLGLYTTKNIIESHNGKIWFDSEEGEGTTFYFSIPFKV